MRGLFQAFVVRPSEAKMTTTSLMNGDCGLEMTDKTIRALKGRPQVGHKWVVVVEAEVARSLRKARFLWASLMHRVSAAPVASLLL